jgi:hypothetical protein
MAASEWTCTQAMVCQSLFRWSGWNDARVNNKQSDFGGYLDIVLDMVAYVSIPLGLAFALNRLDVFIALTLLFAMLFISTVLPG